MYEHSKNCTVRDQKAFLDIVELVASSTPEQVWAMYCFASGLVQYDIESAVLLMIGQGNTSFSRQFPQLRKHA
ncbi:hypothetical protein [Pseudomonas ovata]|uniref:hypothetical protein n=1 Tax=Pseudomonas ovata TaxID=1839709 RepID=UPI000D687CB2|nr:hypothetical protein [Pseudomonas ovata]